MKKQGNGNEKKADEQDNQEIEKKAEKPPKPLKLATNEICILVAPEDQELFFKLMER